MVGYRAGGFPGLNHKKRIQIEREECKYRITENNLAKIIIFVTGTYNNDRAWASN